MNREIKNKVLLVAPGGSFFTEPFSRAFSGLGYECKKFDFRQGQVFTNKILKKIINRIPALRFLKTRQTDSMNRLLINLIREYQPMCIFVQKGENIYPETIEEIKKMGVVTINHYIDMIGHWKVISKIAPVYDYFFSVDYVVLDRLWRELELKNCFYMPLAAEPILDPFFDRRNLYDISFIGTHNNQLYSTREKCILAIRDLGLHVWGTASWANVVLNNFHGRSFGEERFDIYAQSKIVLDTNWDLLSTDFVSSRAFEAMGSGAMFMTAYSGEAIKNAYIEGEEIVLFKDEKDLREKVIYYIKNDKERNKIARAGHARTMAEHTYDKRVRKILDIIKMAKNPVNSSS